MVRTLIVPQTLPRGAADLSTTTSESANGNYFTHPGGIVLMSFFSALGGTVKIRAQIYADTILKVPDLSFTLTNGVVKLWAMPDTTPYRKGDGTVEFDTSADMAVAAYYF